MVRTALVAEVKGRTLIQNFNAKTMHQNRTAEPHHFNLAGMKPGDWFLGCPRCWTQLPKNAAGATACTCGGRMLIYDIRHHDMAEVAQHNAIAQECGSRKSPNASVSP